jgi:hypothetical protein
LNAPEGGFQRARRRQVMTNLHVELSINPSTLEISGKEGPRLDQTPRGGMTNEMKAAHSPQESEENQATCLGSGAKVFILRLL